MTKDQFINKYLSLLTQYYMDEGRNLDYNEDELYDYAHDVSCFTLVGTIDEILTETKDFHVIVQDEEWLAVETFNGIMYDDVCL